MQAKFRPGAHYVRRSPMSADDWKTVAAGALTLFNVGLWLCIVVDIVKVLQP